MEEARGRWAGILPRLGIGTKFLSGKHGPCPMCGGRDRFRYDDKGDNGTYICNQCGAGSGIKLVMRVNGWDFATAAREIRRIIPQAPVRHQSKDSGSGAREWQMSQMMRQAVPIAGTMADEYLSGRGLGGVRSPALGFLERCPISDIMGRTTQPAMIGLVTTPHGRVINLHRTYLDGPRKAALVDMEGREVSARKLMAGQIPDGSAIRLSAAEETLGVSEGIETGLAAQRLFDVPVWACLNSSILTKFIVPDGVKRLIIFGDNDRKYGGQAAAYQLAHKIAVKPGAPEVLVRIPDQAGADWCDIWTERQLVA